MKFFKKHLLKSFVLLVFFIFTVMINYLFIFHPTILNQKISQFKNNKPRTLKEISGSILGNNLDAHILKIKYKNEIYLKFYIKEDDENFRLIDQLALKGRHDGFFEYWDDALSLALLDDNGDGFLEIIAPTFDKFFKPHLNFVFYNETKKRFEIRQVLKKTPKVN